MWFFRSPTLIHGEDALMHLRELKGARAFIVTDANIRKAGLLDPIHLHLEHSGIAHTTHDEIEAEPALRTIQLGADLMHAYAPDWIIAVGGGSVIDAAKAMWVLYENPGLDLEALAPVEEIDMRKKARFVAIPTTAGTGSEATWAFVVTLQGNGDHASSSSAPRKLGSGHPLAMPDFALIDPHMTRRLPARVTADSGMDALTQAIEGYLSTWANDYTDGLCLIATKLALEWLPVAYANPDDLVAREKMANSAAIAGLGYINSMVGLAHSMGHALGALFQVPHGRAVGLFLPYVIEFYASANRPADIQTRFVELAKFLDLRHDDEQVAGHALAHKVRELAKRIDQPLTISDAGVPYSEFEAKLDALIDNAMNDTVIFSSPRQPSMDELRQLFVCAFEGGSV
jgi:alcohol dehydrogenase class IV